MGITVDRLTKRFGATTALSEVTFDIPQGAFFAVVGASGCGKSTLLRLIAGLETPSEGTIALRGETVASAGRFVPPEARGVGVVFQSYALWPHLSVAENVAFPYEAQGLARTAARERAAGHIATVALEPFADRRPDALSGGQRQRVALARCLAGEARTILMDEPLANLDPHLRADMEGELRAFHDRSGATTLYITHDQREAMALADVMAVMDRGRILQLGRPAEIFERPATETVARFIGRGAIFDAEARAGAAEIAGTAVPFAPGAVPAVGPLRVLVRPRDIALGAGDVSGRVTAVHYRGGLWEAAVEIPGLSASLVVDLDRAARPGDMIEMRLTRCWPIPDAG